MNKPIDLCASRCARLVLLSVSAIFAVHGQIETDLPPRIESRVPVAIHLSKDFFAFDNGTGRDQKLPPEEQAALLRETGYAGMGVYTGTERIPEILKALDARNLRLLNIYVHSFVDESGPRIQPGLEQAIAQLARRETMLLLTVQGHGKDAEQRAVENVQTVADMAAKAGLRVCLYPHINFYVETTEDAMRVIRKANRPNVGTALNLYHTVEFHRQRCGLSDLDFPALLRTWLPQLYFVSINGMAGSTITRLGEGDYDVKLFLRALNDAGYKGPVGLQGYQVAGPVRDNLTRSRQAWEEMLATLGGDVMQRFRRPPAGRRPGR